jgi:hypothetical protein
MIVGWFLDAFVAIVQPLVDALPVGHLSLPDASGLASTLSDLDSLVPILGVLRIGAVMLAALAAFFAVRLAVMLWQQVKW